MEATTTTQKPKVRTIDDLHTERQKCTKKIERQTRNLKVCAQCNGLRYDSTCRLDSTPKRPNNTCANFKKRVQINWAIVGLMSATIVALISLSI